MAAPRARGPAGARPGGRGGHTPLHIAVSDGNLARVRRLLDKGADINAKSEQGWTPLHVALMMSRHPPSEVQASGRRDPRHAGPPLKILVHPQTFDGIAKHLIERGADVNARTGEGETPLHFAASGGQLELARMMVGRGADVDAKASDGLAPIDLASHKGWPGMVSYLHPLRRPPWVRKG